MKAGCALAVGIALLGSPFAGAAVAQTADPELSSEAARSVQAWVTRPERTPEEQAVDAYRRPAQTLDFFGLQPDMKVIEFVPGGGYYSELLAQGLSSEGELLLVGSGSNNAESIAQASGKNVAALPDTAMQTTRTPGSRGSTIEAFDLGVTDADMFFTARNLHNFSQESRSVLHDGVFAALNEGGVYAIIEHTGRHNAPDAPETWRRVDPVQVIKEVQAAGFVFEDFSNLHFQPDDTLQLDTTDPSINRNSDRFTLLFRKP